MGARWVTARSARKSCCLTTRVGADRRQDDGEVARDLDLNHKAFGNWVRSGQVRTDRDVAPGALCDNERTELERLKKENAEYRFKRELLR